jgi:hypothetical protein
MVGPNSVLFSLIVYARSPSQYTVLISSLFILPRATRSGAQREVVCISNTLYHRNHAQYAEERVFALIAQELRISKFLNGGSYSLTISILTTKSQI